MGRWVERAWWFVSEKIKQQRWLIFLIAVMIAGGIFVKSGFAQNVEAGAPKIQMDPKVETLLRKVDVYLRSLQSVEMEVQLHVKIRRGAIERDFRQSGIFSVSEPNRIAYVAKKGLFNPTVICDGTVVTIYLPAYHQYLNRPAPKTIDQLFTSGMEAGSFLQASLPMAQVLLAKEPYNILTEGVEKGQYLGRETRGDTSCHHIKLAQQDIDWELWIADGDKPVICKIQPDLTRILAQNQQALPEDDREQVEQSWELVHWKENIEFSADRFQITAPAGAEAVEQFTPTGAADHPMVGMPAPNFKMDLLDGGQVELSTLKGKKVIILDFWEMRCGPCRSAMPIIDSVARQFQDRDVALYTVNATDSPEKIRQFMQDTKIKAAVALDKDHTVFGSYMVRGIPHTVIIGKDGIVRRVHSGFSKELRGTLSRDLEEIARQTGTYDLRCAGVTLQPNPIRVGEPVTVSCLLENTGDTQVDGYMYSLQLFVDDQFVLRSSSAVDIAPGQQSPFTVDKDHGSFQIHKPGTYTYKVILDAEHRVTEIDESNNIFQGEFKVLPK